MAHGGRNGSLWPMTGVMRALSIRQPFADLILRGTCGQQIKPIEFRRRPTPIIGERFHKGASRQWAAGKLFLEGGVGRVGSRELGAGSQEKAWSTDLAMPRDEPPRGCGSWRGC